MTEAKSPATTRIFVGGLGESVTEDDIRKTFSNLGSLESIDIIRTKGRSFAYINFLPSSQNSLNKLFSMYNGCSWKGRKLKLEKAKEHYVDRMKREREEDAELESSAEEPADVDGNMVASVEQKSTLDLEKTQIHIFFPKLRKMRSLPLKGSGKHKYSFQRVQVPSLPIHICDCCLENSDPVPTPRPKFHNADIQDAGIKEEEINMMNSAMNRVLNKQTCSESKPSRLPRERESHDFEIQDGGVNEEEINLMESVMRKVFNKGSSKTEKKGVQDYPKQSNPISDFPIVTNDIDDGSNPISDFPIVTNDIDDGTDSDDDDDIKINMVSGHGDGHFLENWKLQTNLVNKEEDYPQQSNPVDTNDIDDVTEDDDDDIQINTAAGQDDEPFPESWELQTNWVNETAKSNEQLTSDGLMTKGKQGTPEKKGKSSNKKRKLLSDETDAKGSASPMPKKKARLQTQSKESEELLGNQNSVPEPITKKSSKTGMWSQKSSWKQLVEDGGRSSAFSMSHIAPDDKSSNLDGPTTDNETLSNSNNETSSNSDNISLSDSDNETLSNSDNETSSNIDNVSLSNSDNETLSNSDEHKRINNVSHENSDGQSSEPKEQEESPAAQARSLGPSSGADKSTRGSSWLQKCSWTKLVGGDSSSSFSISQIVPEKFLEKQETHKANTFPGTRVKEPRTSRTAVSGSRGAKPFFLAASNKKKNEQASISRGTEPSKAPNGSHLTDETTAEKKSSLKPKKASNSVPGVGLGVRISETCPFMRNAESSSGAAKKRNNSNK